MKYEFECSDQCAKQILPTIQAAINPKRISQEDRLSDVLESLQSVLFMIVYVQTRDCTVISDTAAYLSLRFAEWKREQFENDLRIDDDGIVHCPACGNDFENSIIGSPRCPECGYQDPRLRKEK